MQTSSFDSFILVSMLSILAVMSGCGRVNEKDVNAQSKMVPGSPEWNKAAAEDITVRIMAVLLRPAAQLSWVNERDMLQLTPEEKEEIATNGVTGKLEVVHTTGSGGNASREVRVVIIQSRPLKENARLPVPENGSAIYIEKAGILTPVSTNFFQSSLTLEIFQEKKETTFFMDYPRDRVRAGGAVFWWDESGKWHEL